MDEAETLTRGQRRDRRRRNARKMRLHNVAARTAQRMITERAHGRRAIMLPSPARSRRKGRRR